MDNKYIEEKKEEYNELLKNEKEIKDNLNKPLKLDYKYYVFIDSKWFFDYKKYLIDVKNNNTQNKFIYNINDLDTKTEEKIFYLK